MGPGQPGGSGGQRRQAAAGRPSLASGLQLLPLGTVVSLAGGGVGLAGGSPLASSFGSRPRTGDGLSSAMVTILPETIHLILIFVFEM